MGYSIFRTDTFNDQLHNIIFYIAETNSNDVAIQYLKHIEKVINQLKDFPMSGITPRYQVLKMQGYRVLVVERHLIFYKIYDAQKRIILFAIFDGKQEYQKLL